MENGNQVCGPTGDTTDKKKKALNANKNRTDLPGGSDYVDINWDDLSNLPSDRVNDFQGAPVSVIGFLSHQIKLPPTWGQRGGLAHLSDEVSVTTD